MSQILEKPNRNLVEVIFDDPTEFDTSYDKKQEPVECRTVGWLDDENSSYLKIIWLREMNDEPYVGLSIPRGCVKQVRPIFLMSDRSRSWEGWT